MSVKGFNVFDEEGNVVRVEKYDYSSLDNIPETLVHSSEDENSRVTVITFGALSKGFPSNPVDGQIHIMYEDQE